MSLEYASRRRTIVRITRSPMSSRCRVQGCRHQWTHTTVAHRCGTCGATGHGQLECASQARRRSLESFFHEVLHDTQCDVPLCPDPQTHQRSAHVCATCGARGGGCACTTHLIRRCPMCNTDSSVDLTTELYTGTDCVVCMQSGPVVVFTSCRHATVCKACALRL